MFDLIQCRIDIEKLSEDVALLEEALKIEEARVKISELENSASEPDFWLDVDRAQKIQVELRHLQKKVDTFTKLMTSAEDLTVLCELVSVEPDEDTIKEITDELEKSRKEYEKLRLETLLDGEYDASNAILTIHAGSGGTEAMDWAEMLFRMYTRWAERNDYEIKVLDYQDGGEAGIKSVSFMLSGENVYGYMRSEIGVHRLVRISPFDSSGRRHTSFASLEVIPEIDDTIEIDIRSEDLRVDTYRSSGAGGQHVNKTESAVRITHLPTGVVVSCQSERSQIQNRDTAMNTLKSRLFALAKSKHMDKIDDLKGEQLEIAWGSQIRSYVFCPYTMVKDHRTNQETSAVHDVMDGDIDDFIFAFLAKGGD